VCQLLVQKIEIEIVLRAWYELCRNKKVCFQELKDKQSSECLHAQPDSKQTFREILELPESYRLVRLMKRVGSCGLAC